VREDALDAVAALIAAGVDPDAPDGRPLAAAAAAGQTETLQLLLDAGAQPDLAGVDRQTPLVAAVMHRQTETVKLLLAAGADPSAGEQYDTAPILFATDVEIARLLLDAGADVDARDGGRATALIGAATIGDVALVDVLLQHGADPRATDAVGRTAMLLARIGQWDAIQERLLEAGAEQVESPQIAAETLGSYAGRYGTDGRRVYEVAIDPGRLLLIEQTSAGTLFANTLVPLSATRFYRSGDPGAVLFELQVEDGQVTALARTQGSSWIRFPRLPDDPV